MRFRFVIPPGHGYLPPRKGEEESHMGIGTSVFINLPVEDLDRSKAFFSGLGFEVNPQYTDKNAACLVISETIFAMLLTKDFFGTFMKKKAIADSRNSAEVIIAISAPSRAKVDEMVEKAMELGAAPLYDPSDFDFMYSRSFQDPDSHNWEVVYMDSGHTEK
jgi:uncharacterized protein